MIARRTASGSERRRHRPRRGRGGASALSAAQAAFGDAPVPEALDIAILDRTLPEGELSALRAGRTILVA
jgi:hypothetical protein